MQLDPYRAVRGQSWKKREIQEWNEKTYLAFFEVVHRFTVIKGLTDSISITGDKLIKLEEEANSGQFPFLQELVARMNELTTNPKSTPRKFFQKFTALMRTVGAYIREHPSVVTEQMRESMEKNQRIAWMLTHYVKKETKFGVPMVVESKLDNVPGRHQVQNNPDPNILIMESSLKLGDILHTLTHSLTKKELRRMKTDEKLRHGVAILKTLASMKSYKPNIGVFNQIVIKSANRQELEEAMLDFNQAKET